MNTIELFFKTIWLRPYVFIFLAAFIFSSTVWMGLYRTLVFWFGTWFLAFCSEYASTRIGFPYGFYSYTQNTLGQELFIFNVPFMDSLSYSFLLFASYNMALFSLAPLRRRGWAVDVVDDFKLRGSFKVLFLTSLYMMMIDVVIDPVALQGHKWFLGQIYHYDYKGYYFGVPLSNAAGWFIVGFCATMLYQFLERRYFGPSFKDQGLRRFKMATVLGVGLYYGVLLFNMAVTAYIEDWGLLIADVFIFLCPTVMLTLRMLDDRAMASELDVKNHNNEFQLEQSANKNHLFIAR